MTAPSSRPRSRPGRLDPDELAALEEQRDFLLRSLADLDREHAAGDLADDDYTTLRDDYTARAAEVLRAIERREQAFADARRPRSAGRTAVTVGIVVVIALVAGLSVAKFAGPRQAGDTATGGITAKQTPSQLAQTCIRTVNTDPQATVTCYRKVLEKDPRNYVALTWLGWSLEIIARDLPAGGTTDELRAAARSSVEKAIEINPDYSYARAFRAVLAYRAGEFAKAKQYLADFEAGDPSKDAEAVIAQMDLAKLIDQGLDDASPTTSTTVTTSTAPG